MLRRTVRFALCIVAGSIALTRLDAQPPRGDTLYVKFVCGERAPQASATDWDAVAPGRYFTAVNIVSPAIDTARIATAVASTRATPTAGGLVIGPTLTLNRGRALEIDCVEILKAADSPKFLKGFLKLTSNVPIEVVAVYTAANKDGVVSIQVDHPLKWTGVTPR